MKVCIICGYYNYFGNESRSQGGAEYQAFLLARELIKQGNEVSFISIGDRDEMVYDRKIAVHFLRKRRFLRKFGPYYILDSLKIRKIIKSIKPQIIYVRGGSANIGLAYLLTKKSFTLVVFHVSRDRDVDKWQFTTSLNKLFYNIDDLVRIYGLRRTLIICQTMDQQRRLKANFNKRSILIRNFHIVPEIPRDLRKRNLICWIANISDVKNPLPFIELSSRFRNEKYKFIMVGRKPRGGPLENIFKQALNNSNVEYLGELTNDEVNDLLLHCKLLCSTSVSEGFPNVFVQAWLNKVPVLSLYVDPDNLLELNKIGFRVGNIENMAGKIRELMEEPELLDEYANNARKFAIAHFDIEKNIQKLINLFKTGAVNR